MTSFVPEKFARVGRYITSFLPFTLPRNQNSVPISPSPPTSPSTSEFESSPTMPASQFLELIAARRSNYALSSTSPIPDAKIVEIVQECVKHVPSSFNSQSSRVVILFRNEHEKLWDITTSVLKEIVPADKFPSTEQRMGAFKAGYGTVSCSLPSSIS